MFINDLYYAIKIWKRARKLMIPTIGEGKSLHILANGPSLRQMYEKNIDFLRIKMFFVLIELRKRNFTKN